jgi:type II secretion system protein I
MMNSTRLGARLSRFTRRCLRFTFCLLRPASRFTVPVSPRPLRIPHPALRTGFTLIEVMIACGIFFMATFAILALVAGTLRNARNLQRRDVDAGMAAAQVYPTVRTNRQAQGSLSGDFGDAYPGFSWEAAWDVDDEATNGLLRVDIVVNRRGLQRPADSLSFWVFNPDARTGPGIR